MKQTALQDTVYEGGAGGLDRRGTPHGPFRRVLRRVVHFFSYHLILARRSTRVVRAAGSYERRRWTHYLADNSRDASRSATSESVRRAS